jgi:tetratricopeptide (TPR) repeat protein
LLGAIAEYQKATALDPKFGLAHSNLGNALKARGDPAGAVLAYRKAVALDPRDARTYHNLGVALTATGDLGGAVAAFRQAVTLAPNLAQAYGGLGVALYAKEDLAGAIAAFHQVIALNPEDATAHYNLGLTLAKQGRWEERVAAYQAAIRINPAYAEAHCNLGQALLERGRFEEAVQHLRRGDELGRRNRHWPYPSARWVQDAERLADLDRELPAILRGKAKPPDPVGKVLLAELCLEHRQRYAAAARFYSEAFAARAALAGDRPTGKRYDAARAAVRASRKEGKDAATLDGRRCADLRRQGLDWLQTELTAWEGRLAGASPQDREEVRATLLRWQQDPDLSGLRDPAALFNLSDKERARCLQFWADVAALLKRAQEK